MLNQTNVAHQNKIHAGIQGALWKYLIIHLIIYIYVFWVDFQFAGLCLISENTYLKHFGYISWYANVEIWKICFLKLKM